MKKYAKFVAALLSAAGVIASSGLLQGQAALILNTCIAAAGAAAVILVPNIDEYYTPAEPALVDSEDDDEPDPDVPDLV